MMNDSQEEEKSAQNFDSLEDMQFKEEEAIEAQNDEFTMQDNQQQMERSMSEKSIQNLQAMNDSRFTAMVEELTEQYSIPQYGEQTDSSKFEVNKPSLVNNKFVAYHVKGEDNLGNFDGMRRYNEFFMLRNTLCNRWPGIYVPSIPPKKAVGNKDVKFIIERRYFLERFLKQLSQSSYLLNSEEFRIFARPEFTGGHPDVQSQLIKLPKLGYEDIGKKFIEQFGVNDAMLRILTEKQQDNQYKISEFEVFIKKLLAQYKALRKELKGLAEIKNNQIANQSIYFHYNTNLESVVNALNKYEEKSLHFYVDGNQSKMILGDNTNDLYKSLKEMVDKMRNPFNNLYYWVKGEILDVVALEEAIHQRSQISILIQKTNQKKSSLTTELEKLLGGKKSLKTLFKSTNEKQNYSLSLQKQIEHTDKQIEGLETMGLILDWHLGEITIPTFKKEKISNFSNILREMSSIEVDNSNIGATYWSKVLSNSNLKHF